MPRPRNQLISLDETPFYHCVSRCVRRAYLCGEDIHSGQSYEHRRAWLERLLLLASDVFAIKICSYAIMSNHYHVVLHVRPDIAKTWSDLEVVERWHRLFNGTRESSLFLAGEQLTRSDEIALNPLILLWRERLTSISWLMRVVNERIARKANQEDDCTGSFWESRFKSQALLDQQALLACMAYVDLNPIRAGIASKLNRSTYTSIAKRLLTLNHHRKLPNCLEPFVGYNANAIGIPFELDEYIVLLEWTVDIVFPRMSCAESKKTPKIIGSFNIQVDAWQVLTTQFEERFSAWVGSEHIVHDLYARKNYQRIPSTQSSRTLLS